MTVKTIYRLPKTTTEHCKWFSPSRTLSGSSPQGIKGHHDPRTVSDVNKNITYKLTHVAFFSKFVNGWELKGGFSVRTSIGRSSAIFRLSVHVLKKVIYLFIDKLGVSVIMRSLIIFTVKLAIQHRFWRTCNSANEGPKHLESNSIYDAALLYILYFFKKSKVRLILLLTFQSDIPHSLAGLFPLFVWLSRSGLIHVININVLHSWKYQYIIKRKHYEN